MKSPLLAILVLAAPATAASRAELQLGRDTVATLVFKDFGDPPERTRVQCTAGEVGAPKAVEGGLVASWSPPKALEPQLVLCGAVGPAAAALALVDVSRRETLSLSGLPPLSRVEADVSGQRFGPVRADGGGRAELQIVRGPGSAFAEVTATPASGPPVKSRQAFPRPPGEAALLLPSSSAVSADGGNRLTFHAFVHGERPLDEPAVTLTTPDGPQPLKRLSPGIFSGGWTPSPRAADEEVTVGLKGRGARLRLRLSAGMKATASLHLRESVLAADGLAMTLIIARLTDAQGRALSGQPVKLLADRGQVGAVTDRGDGTYVAPYSAPAGPAGPVRVRAELGGAAIATAQLQLVRGTGLSVEPLDAMLAADGTARTLVRISARSADGAPLPTGTEVALSTTLGELPPRAELVSGRVDVPFRAGTRTGVAVIRASAKELRQTASVLLLPGEPARIELRVEPSPLGCDETGRVELRVRDRAGNLVEAVDVKLAAAPGTVTAPQPEDGRFVSELSLVCGEAGGQVRVEARAGPATATTQVSVERARAVQVGLRAAGLGRADLGGGLFAGGAVEVDGAVRALRGVRLGLELNGALGSRSGASASAFGLHLSLLYAHRLAERLTVGGGAGLYGQLLDLRLSGDSPPGFSQAILGAHASGLLGWRLGHGALVGQLRASLPLVSELQAPASVELSLGYRVQL